MSTPAESSSGAASAAPRRASGFARSTIVVTGAAGFIGGHVVKQLLEGGHDVRATVRDHASPKCDFLKAMLETEAVKKAGGTMKLFKADLLVPGAFEEAFTGTSVVIHVAAAVSVENKTGEVFDNITPGLIGAQNICETANKCGVKRIVFTSSTAAVEQVDSQRLPDHRGKPFDETEWRFDTRPQSTGCYACEKVASERCMYENFNGEVITFNPSFNVGPVLSSTKPYPLVVDMIHKLATHAMSMSPPWNVGYVDVRDTARAHIIAALIPAVPSNHRCRRYLVTSSKHIHMSSLAHSINKTFPHLGAPETEIPFMMTKVASWFPSTGLDAEAVADMYANKPGYCTDRIRNELKFVFEYTDLDVSVKDQVESMMALSMLPATREAHTKSLFEELEKTPHLKPDTKRLFDELQK